MPVGPKAGDLLKAGRQGTETLGRAAHRHIPALLRGIGRVLFPHRVYAAAGQFLHSGGFALEQHGVGGQVPTKKNILRVF